MTREDIMDVSCIAPEHSDFIDNLVAFEFLGLDGDTYFLPNWVEEQPFVALAEERSRVAAQKAEKRWGTRDKKDVGKRRCHGNATAMPEQCSSIAAALPEQCSNTNSNALKSPPSPPLGGESEVPVNEIAELYAEVLPELPKPVLTKRVTRDIGARWNAEPERQRLEWWRGFFSRVRTMPRLMGEGDEKLCASLGWLVNRGCMDRVLAGQYLTRQAGGSQPLRSMSDAEFEAMRVRQAAAPEKVEQSNAGGRLSAG
jgi:hypothetical protein